MAADDKTGGGDASSPGVSDAATLVLANGGASASGGAPLEATRTPAKIGRYTVLRELGAGAMGVVYLAYDAELDRKLAIKLLRRNLTRGGNELARMRREAQAMARLSHPNVAHVYEVDEHAGSLFLAMEFVQGVTLREWLRQQPRELGEVLAVFRQAGRGLAAAHEAGLVHRDFKPDNFAARPV